MIEENTEVKSVGEMIKEGSMNRGELLARMDRAASIAARRHCRRIVTTVSVNQAYNGMYTNAINFATCKEK